MADTSKPIGRRAGLVGGARRTMAATTNQNLFGRNLSWVLYTRFNMDFKSYWTFVFIIVALSQSFANDDDHHEMEEFLKREYSLSKPYQGIVTTPGLNV